MSRIAAVTTEQPDESISTSSQSCSDPHHFPKLSWTTSQTNADAEVVSTTGAWQRSHAGPLTGPLCQRLLDILQRL